MSQTQKEMARLREKTASWRNLREDLSDKVVDQKDLQLDTFPPLC